MKLDFDVLSKAKEALDKQGVPDNLNRYFFVEDINDLVDFLNSIKEYDTGQLPTPPYTVNQLKERMLPDGTIRNMLCLGFQFKVV